MTLQVTVAAIAAIVSGLSFLIALSAYFLGRQNAVASRRPVLVFEWTNERGWRLRNPGNGPAVNIRVSVRGKKTAWTPPVTIPSLATDAVFELTWIGYLNAWMLGAEYEDFAGTFYTTISQHDLNYMQDGHRLSEFVAHDKDFLTGRGARRHWNAADLSKDESLT